MVGFVESRTDSGLVVAEHGADEAQVARALKQHDSTLRLIRGFSEQHRTWVWKVYRYTGGDRPAVYICSWMTDDGTPLPLSMRLLDRVKMLDPRVRGDAPDPDKLNEHLRQQRRRRAEAAIDTVAAEHEPRVDRGRVQITTAQVASRVPHWRRRG